ncbi:hypothetical protein [Allocoleopsis sp.]|uniref:hypothetical protein n=1 Tax=Allocoleopsis sp. TaxID=3088169 RepID=UPI002FD5D102
MKPPDFLLNFPAPARMLFRPMLMISLLLHGIVLMLPISSDLNIEGSKTSKQYKPIKIAQLPRTRSTANPTAESPAKPNPQPSPQPSQSIPGKLPTRPDSSLELNPQPSPQLSQPIPLDPPTRPKPITTRPQLDKSPILERKLSSQAQSQKEDTQQQSTQQPKRSQPTEQPKRSQSIEEPTPSPYPQQPTPSPSIQEPIQPQPPQQPTPSPPPQQPTPSPSTEQAKGNNEGTGGGYGQYNLSLPILAAIEEIKPRLGEDRLKQFKAERDINKLKESNQFKANGEPDTTRFIFLQKALSPLTTHEITSALQTQLKTKDFHCEPNPKTTYGGGPVYEVTQGDVKFYLIFAPGMDDNGAMTAIIFSPKFPT